MSFFSLDWFKSKKQKQLDEFEVEAKKLRNLALEQTINESNKEEEKKPYHKVKFVNNVLTVVFHDGSVISKPGATVEDFKNVRNSSTEDDIIAIVATKELAEEKRKKKEEIEKVKYIHSGIPFLKTLEDFEVKEDAVYLKGTNRSIPQLLVEKFVEIVGYYVKAGYAGGEIETALQEDEEYVALKRFFMWCCLNPRAEVADSLYEFLMKNSFRITKQGFFVALRNVVTVSKDNEIVQFVSNAYNKIKAVWKKKPSDYRVVQTKNGDYSLEKVNVSPEGTIVGNLETLYMDLPNMVENRFTDDWTKTFDIRIGRVVNMPMEECNWSTQDCAAAGLHFTADQIHYVGCGDTSVLIIINPMKVVGIGESKGRCYEYLPIMTVPREEATEILHDLDFDTLELDESFAIHELENLKERVQEGFSVEAKKHDFSLPEISAQQIDFIVKNLDEMKNEISNRIVSVE